MCLFCSFFYKQKAAYEMRISDWSSDVCSSDLATFSLTFPYKLACFAGFAQAHGFKRQQLGDREAIMDLGEVQVIHGNSRSVVGPLECQVGAFEAGQIFSGKGKEVVDLLCRTEANRTFKSASDIRVSNDNGGRAIGNE